MLILRFFTVIMTAVTSNIATTSHATAMGGNSGITGVAVADAELVGVAVEDVDQLDETGCDRYSLDSATKV